MWPRHVYTFCSLLVTSSGVRANCGRKASTHFRPGKIPLEDYSTGLVAFWRIHALCVEERPDLIGDTTTMCRSLDPFRGWGAYLSIALPGLAMTCLEWWTYEVHTALSTLSLLLFFHACKNSCKPCGECRECSCSMCCRWLS